MDINSKFTKFMKGSREKIKQLMNLQDSYKLLEKNIEQFYNAQDKFFQQTLIAYNFFKI